MKKVLYVEPVDSTIFLTTDIVYTSRVEFCGCQYVPLKFSLLRPRYHFDCDRDERWPVIVFLCGGGWTETDHNAWLPELMWFAKHGWAVASVQYPVSASTRFPESVTCVKEAIRFLRIYAGELRLDMEHSALVGESAGAYLALLCASTPGQYRSDKYDVAADTVDAAVALYPPIAPLALMEKNGECAIELPRDAASYPSLLDTISADMVPSLILHGSEDSLVPVSHSEKIYEHMQAMGVDSSLYIVEGADHADIKFFQPEVKKLVLDFLNRTVFQPGAGIG